MKRLLLTALCCILPAIAAAGQAIEWRDLIDSGAQEFDDPFLDLTANQIDLLRTIVRAREKLARGTALAEEVPQIEARLTAAEETLSSDGIDADWLISQRWTIAGLRETAANAGNAALDGQDVSIAGFAIPGPPETDGTSTVYLVELAGMCSHTPPPPPNQMVRIRFKEGWTPAYMHQPVRVGGRAHIDPSERIFPVVDGDVPMKATWRLDAEAVEAFTPEQRTSGARSEWIEQLRANLAKSKDAADD